MVIEWGSDEDGAKPARPLIKAAEYVRMSTEHQQYSTDNQAAGIRRYAGRHGYEIVRTYADEGKSGLRLDGRASLQQLLIDIDEGRADFEVILVYDVSRWGRFQDPDEAAYYELRCKRAGKQVYYCADEGVNEGTIGSSIIKTVKRAMAGEYSRELSVKVFAGQCRLITLGYRQGGAPGYGLRRMLIDQRGEHKGQLSRGEHKSIATDRVILVEGPPEEIAIVRAIYRQFLDEHLSERQIADRLNTQGHLTDLGRAWSRGTVHQILINDKYAGHNVWGRTSFKLKARHVRNDPSEWIRQDDHLPGHHRRGGFRPGAGDHRSAIQTPDRRRVAGASRPHPVVPGAPFGLDYRRVRWRAVEQRLSGALRQPASRLLAGRLCARARLPQPRYQSRAPPPPSVDRPGGHRRRAAHRRRRVQNLENDLLTINHEITASIVIARCATTKGGSRRWKIRLDEDLKPDLTICVRMDDANLHARDFYILPRMSMEESVLRMADHNGLSLDAFRSDSLDDFFALAARVPFPKAA